MEREIRDTIHGFIERSKEEAKVIDSFCFQRLRYIKQLALAYLVYPGATHTRFEHSMGVMHIAGKLSDKMIALGKMSDEEKRTVRLTGLLHDVGHGPFSHVSENILQKYCEPHLKNQANLEKIHEGITCLIIENDKILKDVLSKEERKEIVKLIKNDNDVNAIMKGIVSGPLDADKQDYLIRDSYYCGVKYGVYDIDRLIHSISPIEEDNNGYKEIALAIPYESIYTLEQFFLAKYHITTQVYRHRIRLISDNMITRGIELGIEHDELKWLKDLYFYKDNDKFINNYMNWDDTRLINGMLYENEKKNPSYKMFYKLKNRQLYKCLFSQNLKDFQDSKVIDILSNIKSNPELTSELEEEIARLLSKHINKKIDKFEVIIFQFSIKSIKKTYRDNEGAILILMNDEKKSTFEQKSALFNSINEEISQEFLEVYAPINFESHVEKNKNLSFLNKEINALIRSIVISKTTNQQVL